MRKWESVNRGTERNAGCNAALWIRTADTNLTMSFPLASNSHRSQKVSTEIRANQTWRGKTRELREGTREWTINRAIRMHSHERLGMFRVYEEPSNSNRHLTAFEYWNKPITSRSEIELYKEKVNSSKHRQILLAWFTQTVYAIKWNNRFRRDENDRVKS